MRAVGILFAICSFGCTTQGNQNESDTAKHADDSGVVNAAMLAFFEESEWVSPDWKEGDLVVIGTKWRKSSRPDFSEQLKSAIERAKKSDNAFKSNKAHPLVRVKAAIARSNSEYQPVLVRKPADLELDDRVVVSDVEWDTFLGRDRKVKDRMGKTGSIRVAGSITPPGYTEDGNYGCVTMGAPWSIHSAALTFFVERTTSGWKVVYVSAIFFV